jgi:hypothetical protein
LRRKSFRLQRAERWRIGWSRCNGWLGDRWNSGGVGRIEHGRVFDRWIPSWWIDDWRHCRERNTNRRLDDWRNTNWRLGNRWFECRRLDDGRLDDWRR